VRIFWVLGWPWAFPGFGVRSFLHPQELPVSLTTFRAKRSPVFQTHLHHLHQLARLRLTLDYYQDAIKQAI
jgi:hypothetical protein